MQLQVRVSVSPSQYDYYTSSNTPLRWLTRACFKQMGRAATLSLDAGGHFRSVAEFTVLNGHQQQSEATP